MENSIKDYKEKLEEGKKQLQESGINAPDTVYFQIGNRDKPVKLSKYEVDDDSNCCEVICQCVVTGKILKKEKFHLNFIYFNDFLGPREFKPYVYKDSNGDCINCDNCYEIFEKINFEKFCAFGFTRNKKNVVKRIFIL